MPLSSPASKHGMEALSTARAYSLELLPRCKDKFCVCDRSIGKFCLSPQHVRSRHRARSRSDSRAADNLPQHYFFTCLTTRRISHAMQDHPAGCKCVHDRWPQSQLSRTSRRRRSTPPKAWRRASLLDSYCILAEQLKIEQRSPLMRPPANITGSNGKGDGTLHDRRSGRTQPIRLSLASLA